MEKQEIFKQFNSEIYFFILKKVRQKNITKDILQNTYLKAYENFSQVKNKDKIRAWLFQIARNEIANYYNQASNNIPSVQNQASIKPEKEADICTSDRFCCFDRFIAELPENYREVIESVYIKGKKQKDTAKELGISLPNVKARIRRAKSILKTRFKDCCHYDFDKNGKLIGEPNCISCNSILEENYDTNKK